MDTDRAELDPAVASVIFELTDYFGELDDSGEGHFGEYARITVDANTLTILHQDNPTGVRITIEPATDPATGH